ncbi:MAG: LamB/YcsF family protein [Clostridiales bacterium]|nr:LamB/YcsF family protein [Clostridiales bacterium]
MKKVDINCDMGEGGIFDEPIMKYIKSANIACGYHAGNEEIMKKTIYMAREKNIIIGAHPGYNDLENFGRKELNYDYDLVIAIVLQQLHTFYKIACEEGANMAYVKLHGALYNRVAADSVLAEKLLYYVNLEYPGISFLSLALSPMQRVANEMGIPCYHEVFADRAYENDGTLVSRKKKGAVITDLDIVKKRVFKMVSKQRVNSINQKTIPINCQSICVHGDSLQALSLCKGIYEHLSSKGVIIESYM